MSSKSMGMDSDSADEFKDASSQRNEEYVDEILNRPFKGISLDQRAGGKRLNCSDSSGDRLASSSRSYRDNEDNNADDESQDKFDDCRADLDEEGLAEAERGLSDEQKTANKEKANQLKTKGNDHFKDGNYEEAIELYTEALIICPIEGFSTDRAILYANRAAAKMQYGSKVSAIEDCSRALKLNPKYMKALIRRAKLFEEIDKLDESYEDYKKINMLDPSNQEAGLALMRLPKMIEERNEKLKTQMFGQLKDLGNLILKPFGLSTNNFQMQKDPNTGSYSINFNQKQ